MRRVCFKKGVGADRPEITVVGFLLKANNNKTRQNRKVENTGAIFCSICRQNANT